MGTVKCLGWLKFGVFRVFFGLFEEGLKLVFWSCFWSFFDLPRFSAFFDFYARS